MTDTLEITDIDSAVSMNIVPQCEFVAHRQGNYHYGDAKYLIRIRPHCNSPKTVMICGPAWDYAGEFGLVCNKCDHESSRDELWTLIEVL
jgi:hypothetical protein